MKETHGKLTEAIEVLRKAQIDAAEGLPEELFWLVSSLTPIINVDLLITNETGQVLLARRDDEFHPNCWHLPGGCIRFGETMLHRVHETAIRELGCDIVAEEKPIAIRDAIRSPITNRTYPNERRHFISVLFKCRLQEGTELTNKSKMSESGYLEWFTYLPDDFVDIQHIYDDNLKPWIKENGQL